jgi:pimeloyl-ACP methyl ester carboxylesterase
VKQLTVAAWQFIGFGSISLSRPAVVGPSERGGRDADAQHLGPGGLRSELDFWRHSPANPSAPAVWMDPMATLGKKYRVVAMDQRNAGRSRTRIAPSDDWHIYAADHPALAEHLGLDRFHTPR